MGYMTCVSILNDGFDQIEKHPEEFVRNIKKGMSQYHGSSVESYPVGNHANPMDVKRSQHADTPQVVLLYANEMIDLLEDPAHFPNDMEKLDRMNNVLMHVIEMLKGHRTRVNMAQFNAMMAQNKSEV